MSHYSCKKCGQQYAYCICPSEPVVHTPGTYRGGGGMLGMKCLDCGFTFSKHDKNLKCPSKDAQEPSKPMRLTETHIWDIAQDHFGMHRANSLMSDYDLKGFVRKIEKALNRAQSG